MTFLNFRRFGNRGGSPRGNSFRATRSLHVEALERRELMAAMVHDIPSGTAGSRPTELVPLGDAVYFLASDDKSTMVSHDLWRARNGANGATKVAELNSNVWANPHSLTRVGNKLFFRTMGSELWVWDSAAGGNARLVKKFDHNDASQAPNFTAFNGKLYFTANDGVRGRELWQSDGTAGGTRIVADIYPYASPSDPRDLTVVGGKLFFSAVHPTYGRELWCHDGAKTWRVSDIVTGLKGSDPHELTAMNGMLYFTPGAAWPNGELWRSDGTAAGTRMVKDLNANQSANPHMLTPVGNRLYFWANSGERYANGIEIGTQLYVSDGTAAGTRLVKIINPDGSACPYPAHPAWQHETAMVGMNGRLYFAAHTGAAGTELWTSDGTAQGTYLLKDILPGKHSPYQPRQSAPKWLTVVDNIVYFTADDTTGDPASPGRYGRELWKTDGSAAGTTLVHDIWAGRDRYGKPYGSNPQYLSNVNGSLYFAANDGKHGVELWRQAGLRVGNASQAEGNSGTVAFEFPVVLSSPLGVPVTFSYQTSDGTAKAGGDYKAVGGTLTIPAGQTRATLRVTVYGDRTVEANEAFYVTLKSANAVAITRGKAGGVIVNDDALLLLSRPTAAGNDVAWLADAVARSMNGPARRPLEQTARGDVLSAMRWTV